MKPSVIVFIEHGKPTLDHLIEEARKKGQPLQRGSDFLKFSAHEGINGVPMPQPKKNVYGTKETEKAVPAMLDRINIMEYLPEGM